MHAEAADSFAVFISSSKSSPPLACAWYRQ